MAGIKALRKIQLGREVTPGTAVVATYIWRGEGVVEDARETVWPVEDVGYLSGVDRSYQPKLLGRAQFATTPLTFGGLLHILEAGIMTVGTGASDGAGTGKVYNYAIPETSQPTIKTYTIEGGDNQQEEEMEYSHVESFELAGKAGEAWTMAANWVGRQVTASTYTGALSLTTVEEALFSKTLLYIDAASGNFGATLKSSTLLEASLKYKTGLMPVFTAEGNLYFTFVKSVQPEILLDVTFEHDATATAEKAAFKAGTSRLIQLKCTGSANTTPGTTYSYKTLIINLAGKWEKFSVLGDQDGNDVVTGTLRARYNSTEADIGNIIVVDELASVP
jgi:hypothetical protein